MIYLDYLKSTLNKGDRLSYLIILVYYVIMLLIAFNTPGTGDDGDSIYHFLFAKYAFAHPENFVEHWAKPVYVLLAAPFAQFGFTGIKVFNVTVTTLAILSSYRIAQQLQIKNRWFLIIALCCAPMYIRLSLSGLTEPLFALALTTTIYLAIQKRLFPAAVLASFLPFIRSEGLVILCVYILYLLFKRKYKMIPLLATGHVLYSIIGWFYYKDFLWVFNRMTYAVWNSSYGSGSALTFIYGMKDFIGVPLTVLFSAGTLFGIVSVYRNLFKGGQHLSIEEVWLVYGSFFSVWISHMLFWSFGLFNSLGLIRVLIAVTPCAGIICLRGFNLITDWKVICTNEVVKKLVTVLLVVSVLLTPYIQLKTQCAFDLSGNQKSILKASEKYKKFLNGHTIYSSAGYSAIVFNYDLFDSSQYRRLQEINQQKKIPVGSAIVWDDFYANESRIAHSNLLFDERFELLETFESADCMGYPNKSAVFMYKGEPAINWMVSDTLFSHGFEAISTTARKSEVFYSGTSSCYVDAVNPYSPGLIMKAGSAPLILPATIRISAMFNPTQIPFDKNMHAQFVASLTHNGVDYFWQSFDVDNMLRNNKTWENVSFKLLIPAAKDTADVLKIYIWNPHKTGIYVDDLLIEQLQEKD